MQEFRNTDGSYTSPKNGKIYKSEKALRAHLSFKASDKRHSWKDINATERECQFCKEILGLPNLGKHERSCYLNPLCIIRCLHCDNPIKDYKHSKGTCSRSCANSYFRTGENNVNYKDGESIGYAAICFQHHEKKCVVCGEDGVIDVHHIDHDRENNSYLNLIPLCPTHHAYCHRGLYFKIEEKINKYLIEHRSVG